MKSSLLVVALIVSLIAKGRPAPVEIFSSVFPGPEKITIKLKNTENRDRLKEIVQIDFTLLSARLDDIQNFRVVNAGSGEEVVYQLEYKGMREPQNLLVQVTLAANSEITLYVQEGKPALFSRRTFARYVPERKDDFAWENNLVGFRMYGKALENTNENAYGIDVWTKRTDKLIVDKWYKNGKYHSDHGEGLDYYSVGLTLGAGDMAPLLNDSIYFSKNYASHQVLDNGPLRSTFRLFYDAWKADGLIITAVKEISLDADSQLNRISVNYKIDGKEEIPAVIGIVKRKDPGDIFFSEGKKIMGYWEPDINQNGNTGVGCILTGGLVQIEINKGHLLSQISVRNNEAVVYYAGASWSKAGQITSAEEWFSYLSAFASRINHPIEVTVL